MPIRMSPNDITLPHNANERIALHAFKCVHTGATLPHARKVIVWLTYEQGRHYLFCKLNRICIIKYICLL
jgi:hypothetical protein